MAGEGIITVEGNLGADAEIRVTPSGKSVTSFSICNTPRVKKDNEWTDGEAIWFRCFVWGKDATGATTLRKGNKVVVTGRFNTDTYVDKEGAERKSLVINVDSYGLKPVNTAEPVNQPESKTTEEPIDDPWAF